MTTYLLDANVLIALTVVDHEHHARASTWLASIDSFAVCPVVEGALMRFLVRVGEDARAAQTVIAAVHQVPGCRFWADSLSYVAIDVRHVRGHRQLTDAYLVGLVAAHDDALLATLDEGLATDLPERTLLLPPA